MPRITVTVAAAQGAGCRVLAAGISSFRLHLAAESNAHSIPSGNHAAQRPLLRDPDGPNRLSGYAWSTTHVEQLAGAVKRQLPGHGVRQLRGIRGTPDRVVLGRPLNSLGIERRR